MIQRKIPKEHAEQVYATARASGPILAAVTAAMPMASAREIAIRTYQIVDEYLDVLAVNIPADMESAENDDA